MSSWSFYFAIKDIAGASGFSNALSQNVHGKPEFARFRAFQV